MHRPIVIAGSPGEFTEWCRKWNTNPFAARYVDDPDELLELLQVQRDVRLWGHFVSNPAYPALIQWLRSRAA